MTTQQITKSEKTPYQRNEYLSFKKQGLKVNSKAKDGFAQYRDITTGGISEPDPHTDRICQFTMERIVTRLCATKTDRAKALEGNPYETREFVYFNVRQINKKGQATIGRITEYTTEERLASMIYRYYNPDHAEPCAWGNARICFSGPSEEAGGSRMPYVEIPPFIIDKSGLTVDDEVLITITNERGDSFSDHYHISNMGLYETIDKEQTRRLIVPLPVFKRAVVLERIPEGITIRQPVKFVTGAEYRKHSKKLSKGEPIAYAHKYKDRPTKEIPKPEIKTVEIPCHRFIEEGMEVTIQLTPEPYSKNVWINAPIGRYDFVIETFRSFSIPGSKEWRESHAKKKGAE